MATKKKAPRRVEGKLRKKRDPNRMYFVDGQGRVLSVPRKTAAKKKPAKKRTAKKKRSRR